MSINRVVISGNLTRDAQLRRTSNNVSVLSFSVAVNDRRKNSQTDEWEDYPNYVDCTLFGALADKVQQYMTKGVKVSVAGKLHYSSWEADDGQKRSKLEVVVDPGGLELMQRVQREEQPAAPAAPATTQSVPAQVQPAPVQPTGGVVTEATIIEPSIYDSDLPW